ncbi:MAG: YjbH domain-containing protein [candidate division Zixibacteria bacterium]|nr:YjbH domain-containing protein [candidate division Zixibacteria bacterium]
MTSRLLFIVFGLSLLCPTVTLAQNADHEVARNVSGTLFDVPPRDLIDMPTAGTLPRSYFDIGLRIFANGGAVGSTNIGLSNRLTIGISYGGEGVVSNADPNWNPDIEFTVKFRLIDEMQYFPGVVVGYASQGDGAWNSDLERYAFKSRGFYAVASRSFYFYKWTSGWHAGINYSMEKKKDEDKTLNGFFGFDATFNYNLALLAEYDLALNDDRSTYPDGTPAYYSGKGRGYLNTSIKWLFAQNLQIELILKDLLVNRREASTFTREVRMTYIDHF